MKHIKNFGGFKNKPEEQISMNEQVFQVDNVYRVSIIVDVESKLLSAYSKKVEQNTGKKIADQYGNNQLAEQLVMWVVKDGLDVDRIPVTAIIGGQSQIQSQEQTQAQPLDAQVQAQTPQSQDDNSEVNVQPAPSNSNEEELPL